MDPKDGTHNYGVKYSKQKMRLAAKSDHEFKKTPGKGRAKVWKWKYESGSMEVWKYGSIEVWK